MCRSSLRFCSMDFVEGRTSFMYSRIASSLVPSSPAFWMNCKAICFILSRSSPFTLVYSGNCFVCLAMLRDMVRSGYSPSTKPRSNRFLASLSFSRCPFYTASSKMQSSKDKSLFSFRSLVYFSLIALPYRRTATSLLAASIS